MTMVDAGRGATTLRGTRSRATRPRARHSAPPARRVKAWRPEQARGESRPLRGGCRQAGAKVAKLPSGCLSPRRRLAPAAAGAGGRGRAPPGSPRRRLAGRRRAGCRARAFTAVLSVTCSEPLLGGDTWHRAVPTVSDRLSEKHGGRHAPSSLRAQAGTGRRHAAGRLARLLRPLDRRRGLAYWVGVSWVESL